jgi:hypothetical protein
VRLGQENASEAVRRASQAAIVTAVIGVED